MQYEQTVNGQRLVAATPDVFEQTLKLSADAIKAGEGFPCVVDLRKKQEMSEFPAAKCKELGINYAHVPVTPETLSEQDIDHCRREFARGWGRVLVISQGGQRALLMVILQAARVQGWKAPEATAKCPDLQLPTYKQYLEGYLSRHEVGVQA